jgi:hypothetical protein
LLSTPRAEGLLGWALALLWLNCVGAFYTTKWKRSFSGRRPLLRFSLATEQSDSLVVLGCLILTGLVALPSILATSDDSVLFVKWDKQPATVLFLMQRLLEGTRSLFIGRAKGSGLGLEIYYWGVLIVLLGALGYFLCRFFRERSEIQHVVLTVVL